MKSKNTRILFVALAIALTCCGVVLGQDSVTLSVAPIALHALDNGGIAEGKKVKIEGVVINRNGDTFTIRDSKGTETVIVATDKTKVKEVRARDSSRRSAIVRMFDRGRFESTAHTAFRISSRNPGDPVRGLRIAYVKCPQ